MLDISTEGTGTLTVTIINECGDTVTRSITITATITGIAKTHCNASLRVFPNPTRGQLQITNYELREDTEYQIFSVVGQVVMQGQLGHEGQVDVSALASGIYFLKVNNQVIKFIKE